MGAPTSLGKNLLQYTYTEDKLADGEFCRLGEPTNPRPSVFTVMRGW